jgi:hypothetical protein
MTEAEWLACADPAPMCGAFREGEVSGRKLRLFAVACCRRVWPVIADERCRRAVEVAERVADGLATHEEQRVATGAANAAMLELMAAGAGSYRQWRHHHWARCAYLAVRPTGSRGFVGDVTDAAFSATRAASIPPLWTVEMPEVEQRAQADLLRDVCGNPFRPAIFAPQWRTDTVLALARQMYDSRDFTATSILADALQDAGCDNEHILNHCRGPGPHVRGCWVVDLVLGKE